MNPKRLTLLAILAALLLTGSSCSKSDTSLVLDFVNSWLQSRGILDENGKPTGGTIKYVASGGWVSSGDKDNDAIIDGGNVIKSIKDADDKAKKADEALAKDPPDRGAALTNLTAAVDSRPKDWYLRSKKGVLLLEMGRSSEAQEYLNTNNSSCDLSQNPGMTQVEKERCFEQLRTEQNFIANANVRVKKGDSSYCGLLKTQSSANDKLGSLASSLGYSDDAVDAYRDKGGLANRAGCK